MVEIATQSKIRRGGTRRHEGDTKKRERRRNGKPEGKQGYASLTRRYRMDTMTPRENAEFGTRKSESPLPLFRASP